MYWCQLLKLILSEYLVDNGYIYIPLLLINFFYKQVDDLSKCQRGTLFLHHLENN